MVVPEQKANLGTVEVSLIDDLGGLANLSLAKHLLFFVGYLAVGLCTFF